MLGHMNNKSPVTFKTKLSVTTVNYSFQPFTIFRQKELHLRCCIGLELNIVTWPTKILKGIGRHPHDRVQPRENMKTFPKYPKNTFPGVFHIKLRIQWKLSTILETSSKRVWSNVFSYVKTCVFWKCIQYTIH